MNLPNGYSKARLYINDEDFEGGGMVVDNKLK